MSHSTIDANEIKADLLAQLQLARSLRTRLEAAASAAEAASEVLAPAAAGDLARGYYRKAAPAMLELVSLTEAVRGLYCLEDYEQYLDIYGRRGLQIALSAHAMRYSDLVEIDEEPEVKRARTEAQRKPARDIVIGIETRERPSTLATRGDASSK